jgi:hypothetical protein
MPTIFSVDTGRCGHKATVKAEIANGGKINITITSTCEMVKRYGNLLKVIDVKDLAKHIVNNPVYTAASSTVGPECLVPCAVISATWTEAGMISKNLLKRYPSSCFRYES